MAVSQVRSLCPPWTFVARHPSFFETASSSVHLAQQHPDLCSLALLQNLAHLRSRAQRAQHPAKSPLRSARARHSRAIPPGTRLPLAATPPPLPSTFPRL